MAQKQYQWHKVADGLQMLPWQPNNMCIVEAGGKKITLALYQNNLFAFAHKCPHASGIMANGFLDITGNVVCPLHRYKFSLNTGRNVTGEGYFLKTYPVQWSNDAVLVGIEQNSLFSFLN
jgi:3-phenylpropionate/trans-cinnamate dioxygenase ferredoxin subunit